MRQCGWIHSTANMKLFVPLDTQLVCTHSTSETTINMPSFIEASMTTQALQLTDELTIVPSIGRTTSVHEVLAMNP